MKYTVLVDSHSPYQGSDAPRERREFDDGRRAIAECERIVKRSLASLSKRGQSGDELFHLYMLYGDDPYIVHGDGVEPPSFSARDFARAHCDQRDKGFGRAPVVLLVLITILLTALAALTLWRW